METHHRHIYARASKTAIPVLMSLVIKRQCLMIHRHLSFCAGSPHNAPAVNQQMTAEKTRHPFHHRLSSKPKRIKHSNFSPPHVFYVKLLSALMLFQSLPPKKTHIQSLIHMHKPQTTSPITAIPSSVTTQIQSHLQPLPSFLPRATQTFPTPPSSPPV